MRIYENILLKDFTTIGIGGRIARMFCPESVSDLLQAIEYCKQNKIPFFILAGGSNTVFADQELLFDQAVINLSYLNRFELNQKDIIESDPGVRLQELVDSAQQHKLSGLTGLNRVPGTIGGAVVGNAGAYGTEIRNSVVKVDYLDLNELQIEGVLRIRSLNNDQCQFDYRSSVFKKQASWLITQIWLQLEPKPDFEDELAKYGEIAEKRDDVYPPGLLSPGSTFKNILVSDLDPKILEAIPEDWIVFGKLPAARLLEEIGAKGYQIGGIQMRPSHANIMINLGSGTFEDVQNMIESLRTKVRDKFGIKLEPEIRLVPADFSQFRH